MVQKVVATREVCFSWKKNKQCNISKAKEAMLLKLHERTFLLIHIEKCKKYY